MIKTKGGYAMVDLAHVSLSGVGVTFAGLYQKLYSKLGKPILLCNINIGGTEYQDCYVQPVYTAEGFEMTVGDYTVTVASNSVVTATEGIVGGETGPGTLAELTDVDITEPANGQVLMMDGDEWKNGKLLLSGLKGVDIDDSTLQEGDILKFDATQNAWVNGQPSAGGAPWTPVFTVETKGAVGTLPNVGERLVLSGSNLQLGSVTETFVHSLAHTMASTDPSYLFCDGSGLTLQNKAGASNHLLSFKGGAVQVYARATQAPRYVDLVVNGVVAGYHTESTVTSYAVYVLSGFLRYDTQEGGITAASELTLNRYA